MMALQPLEDPTGPSFYDTCNKISSLAKAGGVEDAQSMSDEAKDKAMAKPNRRCRCFSWQWASVAFGLLDLVVTRLVQAHCLAVSNAMSTF